MARLTFLEPRKKTIGHRQSRPHIIAALQSPLDPIRHPAAAAQQRQKVRPAMDPFVFRKALPRRSKRTIISHDSSVMKPSRGVFFSRKHWLYICSEKISHVSFCRFEVVGFVFAAFIQEKKARLTCRGEIVLNFSGRTNVFARWVVA